MAPKKSSGRVPGGAMARPKGCRPKGYQPTEKARVAAILRVLRRAYPRVVCALHHESAFQLVIATILSAQCTDVRVNLVTPELFRRFPTAEAMAGAEVRELEELVRTTGFFRNKAKNILGAATVVMERFGGSVPATMEELLELPGVARKTANVVLGSWFGRNEGVVVDTHVLRISRRLELTKSGSAVQVERDLVKILPRSRWTQFSHEVIHHGRAVCVARRPRCEACPMETLCHSGEKTWSSVWMG